jgi:hypothetical protein
MTEVGGISWVSAGATTRTRAAAEPVFALAAEPSAETPGGPSCVTAPAVSLSGCSPCRRRSRRRRATGRRGQDILKSLAELQRGLLGGEAGGTLTRLASLLANLPRAADPRLDAVLGAVALRARIELARRGSETNGD